MGAREAARLERLQQKATAKRWKDEVAVVPEQQPEQKPAQEVAVVAEKKTSREERIAQLKAEREKKREAAKLAAQPPAKLAEVCAAAGVYFDDASLPNEKSAANNKRAASPLASENGKKAKHDKESKDAES